MRILSEDALQRSAVRWRRPNRGGEESLLHPPVPRQRIVDSLLERAIGLGACDIKGAAAAMLTAASMSDGDAAFLFTSDEEANDARCIAAFLSDPRREYDAVIVAEPTRCEAVLAHRGISSVLLKFRGEAGHASGAGALQANALHQAMRWGANALDVVEAESSARFGGLTGLRFNIGRVEGGIKANVVAPAAEVRFGFRPLPSHDIDALHLRLGACAAHERDAGYLFHGRLPGALRCPSRTPQRRLRGSSGPARRGRYVSQMSGAPRAPRGRG